MRESYRPDHPQMTGPPQPVGSAVFPLECSSFLKTTSSPAPAGFFFGELRRRVETPAPPATRSTRVPEHGRLRACWRGQSVSHRSFPGRARVLVGVCAPPMAGREPPWGLQARRRESSVIIRGVVGAATGALAQACTMRALPRTARGLLSCQGQCADHLGHFLTGVARERQNRTRRLGVGKAEQVGARVDHP